MNHNKRNEVKIGVTVSKENRIISTNHMKVTIFLKIYQLILIFLGVIGPIHSLCTGLDLNIRIDMLAFTILGSVLFFYIFFSLKKDGLFIIGIAALLYFTIAFEFIEEIKNGFWNLENIVIRLINKYYDSSILYYKVDKLDKTLVISIFLCFIIVLLAAALSALVLFGKGLYLYALTSISVIALSLVVGMIPDSLGISMSVIVLISTIGMSNFNQRNRALNNKNHILANQFNHVIGLKVGFSITMILVFLFTVIPIFYPQDSYEKLNIREKKGQFIEKIENISFERIGEEVKEFNFSELPNLIQGIDNKIGGLSGGKLFKDGEVSFEQKKVLEVTMPDELGAVYLKGYVGSNYTGDAWTELNKDEMKLYEEIEEGFYPIFNQGNQSSNLLSIVQHLNMSTFPNLIYHQHEMYVKQLVTNKDYSYHPYYTALNEDIFTVDHPLYMVNKEWQELEKYQYYRINNDLLKYSFDKDYKHAMDLYSSYNGMLQVDEQWVSNMKDFSESEKKYRNYVYDTYTKLDSNVSKRMRDDFSWDRYSEGGKKIEGKELSTFVTMVQNYLSSNTSYSLKPGTLPKNKDYIEYFLYDNKIGYCAHYASAATVMLRIMGVPARYVEGYIVKNSNISSGQIVGEGYIYNTRLKTDAQVDMKLVEVLDSNAHAWVEIYVDGIGFVPVEFTVGYNSSTGENSVIDQVIEQLPITPTLKPTSIPYPEEDEQEVSPTPTIQVTPIEDGVDSIEETEDEYDANNGNAGGKDEMIIEKEEKSFEYELRLLRKIIESVVKLILVGILILVCIMIRYAILSYIRYRCYFNKNLNQVLLLKYKECNNMLHYLRNIKDEGLSESIEHVEESNLEKELTILAQKAKFSPHQINNSEIEVVNDILVQIRDSIYQGKSKGVQLYFRYVKLFL